MNTTDSVAARHRFFGLDSLLTGVARVGSIEPNTKIVIGGTLVAAIGLVAIFAPLIAPYGPGDQDLINPFRAPSWAHPFGTDQFGRDVLSRTMYATRLDLQIAFIATVFCFVSGVLFGLLGGYFGGAVDQVIGRLVDLVIAFPSIVAIIALI